MLNQEERDLELAVSLQQQEIEQRRAWVLALAGGQHHQRLALDQTLKPKSPFAFSSSSYN